MKPSEVGSRRRKSNREVANPEPRAGVLHSKEKEQARLYSLLGEFSKPTAESQPSDPEAALRLPSVTGFKVSEMS